MPIGSYYNEMMADLLNRADLNSAKSQEFAREQMQFQAASARQAMDFNAEQAQINRDFQERMSNTAHQREVEDLRRAGLNPILSAMSGNGSAVTSGSSASTGAQAGASGSVDTSADSAIASLVGTLLNSVVQNNSAKMQTDTNYNIAKLNAQTNRDIAAMNGAINQNIADIYSNASIFSALTSASSAREINNANLNYKINNPQTIPALASSVVNDISDILSGDFSVKGPLSNFVAFPSKLNERLKQMDLTKSDRLTDFILNRLKQFKK